MTDSVALSEFEAEGILGTHGSFERGFLRRAFVDTYTTTLTSS